MSSPSSFDLDQAVDLLRRTPHVLRALLAGLDRTWGESRRAAGTWSPREILGHLCHGEQQDWMPRAERLLEYGESQPFEAFDRAGHVERTRERTILELLDELTALRTASLARLEELALTPEDLERTGLHPALGVVTLRELLATWVVHDLAHLRQIARAMVERFASDVGPWNDPDYLGVFSSS